MKNWADTVSKEAISVKQWEVNWGPVFGDVKSLDDRIKSLEESVKDQDRVMKDCQEKRNGINLEEFTTSYPRVRSKDLRPAIL